MGGGNPNNKNWRGESPLHRPAGDGHLNVVVLLLDANSDHNMAAKYGRTPLFYAVESGRLNTTSVLLERGSDSNLKNIFGDTVLHLAAECKHPDIFRILLTSGSDPRIKNKSGEPPYDSFKRVFSDSVETRKLNLTVLEMLGLIQAKEREKEEEGKFYLSYATPALHF
ncbi:uncharacterized protein LOC143059458 [Mytilus galloprovincialis]|uniref:uncharacterized protein LOC143059458 n=1 Tax=Mytilus galloprovincialis TaxID=29158 RepID=UPI003F7C7FEF